MKVDKVTGVVMEVVELRKDGAVYGYEYRVFQPGSRYLVSVRVDEANGVRAGQKISVRGRVSARIWNGVPRLNVYADEVQVVS